MVHQGVGNITIIAPTSSDLRETIVDGHSGILACAGPNDKYKPTYVPSKSRIEWSNGARARLVSAEEADRLRGANSSFCWWDEICAFKDEEAFNQAVFGLRLSPAKGIITSTPKASKLMMRLSKRFGKDIRLITGTTYENADNLDEMFLHNAEETYGGTRLGRQELLGELIIASEDAMWHPDTIANCTIEDHQIPEIVAYACGIDPAVSKTKYSDLTGIILVGLGVDDRLYVLGDYSGRYSPQQWTQKVIALHDSFSQEAPMTLVVERNQGGDLVKDALSRERPFLPIKEVFATANKLARMQPVALLYEQGKVRHVRGRDLSELENEQTSFDGKGKQKSPDRADALVMACMNLSPVKKNRIVTKEFLL